MPGDIRSLVEAFLPAKEGRSVPLGYSIYSSKVGRSDQSKQIILGGKIWFVEGMWYLCNFDESANFATTQKFGRSFFEATSQIRQTVTSIWRRRTIFSDTS